MASSAECIQALWRSNTQTRSYFIAPVEDIWHYRVPCERLPGDDEDAQSR